VLTTLTVGSEPSTIAITPDGTHAYVANNVGATVSVIENASTNTPSVLTTLSVGSDPVAIAITPDGTHAYVVNQGGATVSVIENASTNPSVLTTLTVGNTPVAIAITPGAASGGHGIFLQQGNNGKIINNIVTGGNGGAGGNGIMVAAPTNFNIIEGCLTTNCGGIGFDILTAGTVNMFACQANFNAGNGFDMSESTGKGLIKSCIASQNSGCGFNDIATSLYQYIGCSSEGNGASPANPAGDSNYCDSSATSTFVSPSGPGSNPYYQFTPNITGSGFNPGPWNNITLQ